jgi:SAM-dependent methyltransferase
MQREGVGRALVVSYGSTRRLDAFDQMGPLTRQWPGRIFPLVRVRERERTQEVDERFQVLQLELLWQKGLQYGLTVDMQAPERPSPAILDWVEKRQVLTLWHAASSADLAWLEANVLARYSFPVLLSHFGGYPLDGSRYQACIEWLARYANMYLVTSLVFFSKYLETTIRRHPDRILLGSGFPAVAPSVARAAVLQLDLPGEFKVLVASENLRVLTERVARYRGNALGSGAELLFPRLPETPADLAAQGFEIVPPAEMAPDEDAHAKGYWSQHVSPFYVEHKPWATLVAELARDLQARSVLEFGCHVGRNLAAVGAAVPGCRLVGLDINAEAVRVGRERNKLDLRCGNEQTLAEFTDGEFDLVFTVSVLDHIPDIARVCRELVRVASKAVFFLEVTLPVEGKVLRHFDHKHGAVRPSTAASYSWFVDRHLIGHPRVWRLDCRPYYLHSSALGPYYQAYLAFLGDPRRPA